MIFVDVGFSVVAMRYRGGPLEIRSLRVLEIQWRLECLPQHRVYRLNIMGLIGPRP